MSYSNTTKQGRLTANGWYKDTPSKFEDFPTISNAHVVTTQSLNTGYNNRRDKFKTNNWAYFTINLHTDLSTLSRNLPPNIKMEVELERTKDAFVILSASAANNSVGIQLENLELKVRRYTPNEKIQSHFFSTLAKRGYANIPLDRSLIRVSTVKAGTQDLSITNVIRGSILPDQILVVMILETGYTGNYNKNPFLFSDNKFTEASLVVNGIHEPKNLYRGSVENGNFYQMYSEFLENTGIGLEDRDFGVSPQDFIGGSFILAFDRNPDKCNRYHRHIPSSGVIDLNLRVKEPIQETMAILIYATYSSDLIIDRDFKVGLERF